MIQIKILDNDKQHKKSSADGGRFFITFIFTDIVFL